MQFLRDAIQGVQRNLGAVSLYVVMVTILGLVGLVFVPDLGLVHLPDTPAYRLATVIAKIVIYAGYAAAITVTFARIGMELDRPLWKMGAAPDALRRFFPMWFVILLCQLLLGEVANALAEPETAPLGAIFELLYLLLAMLAVPIGAALMFHGRIVFAEIGEALQPLGRQLARTLLLMFIAFLPFGFNFPQSLLALKEHPTQMILFAAVWFVILAYVDCIVFAGAWIICIADRNRIEDDDFEF